jgi:hypothetical protein
MNKHAYRITIALETEKPLDFRELQHLAFTAADEVLDTIIFDERVKLTSELHYSYREAEPTER